MKKSRGQAIALDFFFALMVFVLVLSAMTAMIDSNAKSSLEKRRASELNSKAVQTIDMLVRTSGQPNNWEKKGTDEITAIGLAKRDLVIDDAKTSKFVEWAGAYESADYNRAKSLLLIGYDYYFCIKDSAGQVVRETGKPADISLTWGNMTAVNVKRIVNFNGDEGIAELTIYYPR